MLATQILQSTIEQLTKGNGGILAADESHPTLKKRFSELQIDYTSATRQAYRELLFTTPQLEQYINGVILFEESITQKDQASKSFPKLLQEKGILPGIKVDQGLIYLPLSNQEKITQGLDGLAERLEAYYKAGARFAKWRTIFIIHDDRLPSSQAIEANAEILARYAACCQTQAMLPIVEPEVLREGTHHLERCQVATEQVLHEVFRALYRHHVLPEYLILKPNMITAGSQYTGTPPDATTIAHATLQTLRRTVPVAVPSINFLSGGQSPEQATAHLHAINSMPGSKPWRLSFSYSRALLTPALQIWQGHASNKEAAQQALSQCAQRNFQATQGIVTS
jgi:fructose-bisphosphate aldolase class I